ncbi:MAG: branched-chain amino acid ABC transporter permease [Nocardioidaceae bacterium]
MTRALGPARWLVFFGVLAALPSMNLAHWVLNMLVFTLMYAVMSSAWNLVGGFGGYPSLGHAAFFGIGAYTEAIWFQHHGIGSGWTPFLVLPLVGLVCALIGLPIGAIAMRTRADVFAIVTITLLFVVQTFAFNLRSVTRGAQGISIPLPPFPAATYERPFYYVLLAMLFLAMVLTLGVLRTKVGLSLIAVRADEDKARGIGVHVTGLKLLAFCVSVGLTGMVGAVWGYYVGFIYPQFAVDPLVTIAMVLMTFLGGRATLWGPVLGAFVVEMAQQWMAYSLGADQFYLIGYALLFLLVMLFLPQGVVSTLGSWQRRRRMRHRESEGSPPERPGPESANETEHWAHRTASALTVEERSR